jgi:hypothetical protein
MKGGDPLTKYEYNTFILAFVLATSNSRLSFSITLLWSRLRCCCCCPRGCCCCCRWVPFPFPTWRGFPVFWLRFRGACLAPEVSLPEFFAGGPAGGGLGDLFLAGHRWNRKHPSLVAMDTCALSWQTTRCE